MIPTAPEQTVDAVQCTTCGVISLDVWLAWTCPRGHGELTATTVTREQLQQAAWLNRLV